MADDLVGEASGVESVEIATGSEAKDNQFRVELFRSKQQQGSGVAIRDLQADSGIFRGGVCRSLSGRQHDEVRRVQAALHRPAGESLLQACRVGINDVEDTVENMRDRKSTRLNSSHVRISY